MYFRLLLFILLGWLIIRAIRQFSTGSSTGKKGEKSQSQGDKSKKVSKDVGEYVDYEEVDD